MSSYHGEKTADIMNDMRRQTKRKQSRGTGSRAPSQAMQAEEQKEAAKFVTRHFTAVFADATIRALQENEMRTEGRPSSAFNLKWLLRNGGIYLKTAYDGISGEQEIQVSEQGFKAVKEWVDGKPVLVDTALKIWTLTIILMEKPVKFGVVFKYDDREQRMWIN